MNKIKPPFDRRRTFGSKHLALIGVVVICPTCGQAMWWSGGSEQRWHCIRHWRHTRTWVQMEDQAVNYDNDLK